MGSETFLKGVQSRLDSNKDSEIPMVQRCPTIPKMEDLLLWVARAYGERVDKLVKPTRRPGEARQVAIYFARRVAGLDLKEIAKKFGVGYTSVSRRVTEIAKRIEMDKPLGKRIRKIVDGNVKT